MIGIERKIGGECGVPSIVRLESLKRSLVGMLYSGLSTFGYENIRTDNSGF